jgi:dihydropteroate synthase
MTGEKLHPRVMGILNVTPDSFSDGGEYLSTDDAVSHGMQMVKDGADIIDIGGESTRPGSNPVPAEVQLQRVIPVIEKITANLSARVDISIDTSLSRVAEAAINAGATMINDVSAGREDPDMFELAAQRQVPLVIMHMLGKPGDMQANPTYINVVKEICEFLLERAEVARSYGVKQENIILDPGIGFGKTFTHNLEIISHLNAFTSIGYPVLLGVSRKRFLQTMVCSNDRSKLAAATTVITTLGIYAGVNIFRVHDVKPNRETADNVFKSLANL